MTAVYDDKKHVFGADLINSRLQLMPNVPTCIGRVKVRVKVRVRVRVIYIYIDLHCIFRASCLHVLTAVMNLNKFDSFTRNVGEEV